MQRPRLKAHYAPVIVGKHVFLLTEDRHFLVSGAAAAAVLPYLDGEHAVADIAVALVGTMAPAQVLGALRKFDAGDHLAEGRPDLPVAELAYWDALGVEPAAIVAQRSAARVAVLALGAADAGPFLDALQQEGVDAAGGDGSDPADLTIVVVEDYLDPELEAVNAGFLASGRPWLLVKPAGVVQWIGPLLRPGTTGCWACMQQRIAGNRQIERYVQQATGMGAVPVRTSVGALPAGVVEAAQIVAVEAQEVLASGTSWALDGRLLTVDRRTRESVRHELIRQPQCAACGEPGLVAQRDPKIVLQPQPVGFESDNGFRTMSSTETRKRLERHVGPVLGAISGLASMRTVDDGITFSYGAGHDFPMGSSHVDLLRKNVRGQSGGKGRTDTQARVSAMAEAVERYSGIWLPELPVVRATYTELGPERAVHPDELLLFSEAQFAHRDEWNHQADMLQTVAEVFHPDCAIDWTAAWSLTHDRSWLVPSAYVWFGHPDLGEHFFAISDANGNAAGNVLEEAILQGLCELIERDCVATWWYNRIPRPAVDLDSLDDPYVEELRRFYAARGRTFWLLDITSDLGVPAFSAVSHRPGHPVEDVVVGFGAHPSAQLAMMRALTEMNQFLPFIEERDDEGNTVYPEQGEAVIIEWLRTARIGDEAWLRPAPGQPARRLTDYPPVTGTVDDAVRDLVGRAERAGLEVLVVDQSRPEIDLHVVKVMAPGMRHFWRRLGPGRLYDVPVQLGWIDAPVPEDQLNPQSVFF